MSVAMFDIDRFKVYNDTHGHAAGDDALRAFGDVLRQHTRAADLAGRYGGEEFLTMLPRESIEGARIYAERVREALASRELPTGQRITVSAGLATSGPTMATAADLIQAADAALYMAKAAGGNRVEPIAIRPSDVSDPARLRDPAEAEKPATAEGS